MFGRDWNWWGKKRFLNFFLSAELGAGIMTIIGENNAESCGGTARGHSTIGASGAIFGILMLMRFCFPIGVGWLFSAATDDSDAAVRGGAG